MDEPQNELVRIKEEKAGKSCIQPYKATTMPRIIISLTGFGHHVTTSQVLT
jgi:hypothetical protein